MKKQKPATATQEDAKAVMEIMKDALRPLVKELFDEMLSQSTEFEQNVEDAIRDALEGARIEI